LTAREREVLDFLLSVEAEGDYAIDFTALRREVESATVIHTMACCPGFDLAVDERALPGGPLVHALHRTGAYELNLFVTKDHLHSVELVHYADEFVTEFPPVSEFNAPILMINPSRP
jgi:hypothetical protein